MVVQGPHRKPSSNPSIGERSLTIRTIPEPLRRVAGFSRLVQGLFGIWNLPW